MVRRDGPAVICSPPTPPTETERTRALKGTRLRRATSLTHARCTRTGTAGESAGRTSTRTSPRSILAIQPSAGAGSSAGDRIVVQVDPPREPAIAEREPRPVVGQARRSPQSRPLESSRPLRLGGWGG